MRNACDGLLSRPDTTKERISEPEDRAIEVTQTETQSKKEVKAKEKKQSTQKLWDNVKYSHIQVIGTPEERERMVVQKEYICIF